MDFAVCRGNLARCQKVLASTLEVSRLALSDAQRELGLDKLRGELNGLLKLADGAGQVAALLQSVAEQQMRLGVVRKQFHSLALRCKRLVEPAFFSKHATEPDLRFRAAERGGRAELILGSFQVVFLP